MIDRPEEYEKMDLTEQKLWWYKILHEQVYKSIKQTFSSSTSIKILDAACGTGGLIYFLQTQGFLNLHGFDASPYAVLRSKAKTKLSIDQLDLRQAGAFYKDQQFDVIVCNDALYFIDEEELPVVLRELTALLAVGGLLIINLPAGKGFKGMHDLSVGIRKRWNFSRFQQQLEISGLQYRHVEYFYWPFLLAPLIFVIRTLQRIRLKFIPSTEITSDVSVPSLALNRIFYKLTKWEFYLPFKKRIGSSLYIVLHR